MGEPARKFDDYEEPQIRPQFGVVKGGGETSDPVRGHLRSVGSTDDVNQQEGAASSQGSSTSAEQAESAALGGGANQEEEATGGGLYNPEEKPAGRFGKIKSTVKARNTARNALLVSSGLTGLVLAFFALISFLMPFKLTHIVNTIESKVGNIPEHAVDRRLEFYMNRFMIMNALEKSGIDFNKNSDYTYLGKGVMGTLYTNWKGAKLDVKLAQKGYRVQPIQGDAKLLGKNYTKPTNWNLIDADGKVTKMNSRESRAFIRDFAKSETKSHQVLKRFNMRRLYKKYYGVPDWKPYEVEIGEKKANYLERKKKFKQKMITKTVGRVSNRYGLYLNCLLDGGDKCKEIRKGNTAGNEPSRTCTETAKCEDSATEDGSKKAHETNADGAKIADGEVDKAISGVLEEGADNAGSEVAEKVLGKKLTEKITEMGLKKVLASFVAGIGIAETISQIEKSLSSGALSLIIYDRNSQMYTNFAAPVLSMADQTRAGEGFDPTDVRLSSEMLGNFSASPVYQQLVNNKSNGTDRVRQDCNADGDTNDPEDLLEPGEVVCPDKRLVQDPTSFTNTDGWKTFQKIAQLYRGSIGVVVGAFNTLLSKTLEVTKLDVAIAGVMSALKLDQAAAAGFSWIMNRVFGFAVTGAETDGAAFDATVAGISVGNSALGGGVGPNREDTIGGAYLNNAQTAAIQNTLRQERKNELKQENFFARYFSPSINESLTSQAILATPPSLETAASSTLNFINPKNIITLMGSLFTPKTSANTAVNPFHVINYGYTDQHEVFSANEDSGIEPEDLNTKYQCEKPAEDRPQNKPETYQKVDGLPFEVATQQDPCLLEVAVVDAATRYFTGKYDEGIDEGGGPTNQTPTTGGEGTLVSGEAKDLARQILDNKNVTYDPGGKQEFEKIASGTNTAVCGKNEPVVLGFILALAQGHKLQVSSLATYGGSPRDCGSPHGKGKAVDMDYFDGKILTGNNEASNDLLKAGQAILGNRKAGFGNCDGHKIDGAASQFYYFADNCNHVHVQIDTLD